MTAADFLFGEQTVRIWQAFLGHWVTKVNMDLIYHIAILNIFPHSSTKSYCWFMYYVSDILHQVLPPKTTAWFSHQMCLPDWKKHSSILKRHVGSCLHFYRWWWNLSTSFVWLWFLTEYCIRCCQLLIQNTKQQLCYLYLTRPHPALSTIQAWFLIVQNK